MGSVGSAVFKSVSVLALVVAGGVQADRLELVNHIGLWFGSPVRSPDTSGLAYHPQRGRLLVADSEVNEYGRSTDAGGARIFAGVNVFEVSLDRRVRLGAHFVKPPDTFGTEPCGIAYNPLDGHVYIADDDCKKVFRYRFADGTPFGAPVAAIASSSDERYTDPEGIACDPETGMLFVVSGTKDERVLKFRFDTATGTFVRLGEFPVGHRIYDPEGIAVDPGTGNLFLIASGGIAEFTQMGVFVQLFDYSFLEGTGVVYRLPGGGVFAPSSDPNDVPDTFSLYISCRGIDNNIFPKLNTLDGAISEVRVVRQPTVPAALRVPRDHATIQAAVEAAGDGDTIVVAPGVYSGPVVLAGKTIVLVSEHFLTGRAELIDQTVIDGNGGDHAVKVAKTVGHGTMISGFTIRNADDGITASGAFSLTHCHVTQTTDGIDYEGGGGLARHCRFTKNRDDGVDLDGATAATIEHCQITDNRDDGIEIRLHPYEGPVLNICIRDNMIARNGEDGIQLIDYDTLSDRRFLIQGNTIVDSAQAGIGCMGGSNTREDFSAAPIPEEILVINNTFSGNSHHITGGARLLGVNNIFVNAGVVALKNVAGSSSSVRSLFWGNAADQINSNVDMATTITGDPQLDATWRPRADSPAIDAGDERVTWGGRSLQAVHSAEYCGRAPDLGAFERAAP